MLTEKQIDRAIKFVADLHGEYKDDDTYERIKEDFKKSEEFKKKLFKFLKKNEKKYNVHIVYSSLKTMVEHIEEMIPQFAHVNKEANQVTKLFMEELNKKNEMDNETK